MSTAATDTSNMTLHQAAVAWLVYEIIKTAWNISPFHPLSKIPGPRLAAATYLPEFYYDAIKFGKYTTKIKQWHGIYGPIIRISPNEVHCNDILFANEIYSPANRRRDKPIHQVRGTATIAHAVFSTADYEKHRIRRNALAKLFAREKVTKLEPKVHTNVQLLCNKILAVGKTPFDITTAYGCYSADMITDYAFGESFGFLHQDSWEPNIRGPAKSILKPIITKFIVLDKVDVPNIIKKTKAETEAGVQDDVTIFGSLLQSSLPEDEKTVARLSSEATALIGAATDTVSWALTVITFHLLTQPNLLERLHNELSEVYDGGDHLPQWSTLEKLPYLSAIIWEGLRLSYGVSARTARIAPNEDLVYNGEWQPQDNRKPITVTYVIPKGFAIGMSTLISHHDENYFPDSEKFDPQRWLDEKQQRNRKLEQNLIIFSKGSRVCLGQNLAFCEIYLALTALVIRVFPRLKLYETTQEDISYDHDMFNPIPKAETKGIRAVIV
ncbi:cytochrome P450 [Truncatella angustata]|uniref:Cytochrome P450 n=1 Tax=Truncatella angustata TaxID=152316 RepID=A0A9P8ZWK0_9PEZI|nr:cytochrome P450 [Truncatella angustata]KAH6653116.1 cytochrome P450 [Truncatella angustata]